MSGDEAMQSLAGDGGVRVWCPGRPRTKGSMKPAHQRGHGGRPCKVWLREDGEFSVAWKKAMIAAVRAQAVCDRWPGAVIVDTTFLFDREGGDDTHWPTGHGYGDVDKLQRNVLDALTQSALLADDALVVGGRSIKRFVMLGESAGVLITVRKAPQPFAEIVSRSA